MFSQAGKTFCTELLYKENFLLDGQNHAGKNILTGGQFA